MSDMDKLFEKIEGVADKVDSLAERQEEDRKILYRLDQSVSDMKTRQELDCERRHRAIVSGIRTYILAGVVTVLIVIVGYFASKWIEKQDKIAAKFPRIEAEAK